MTISTTRKISFLVTLNEASAQTATVDYTTVSGTAIAGTDFGAVSGTLTFAPGVTSQGIDVYLGTASTGGLVFQVALSNPVNCTLGSGGGQGTIGISVVPPYLSRFNYMYAAIKNTANGYFGPPTGPKAFQMPYHCPEKLIAEAPDYGHESVSETISFWVGLETWQGVLNSDWTGYTACWNSITSNYIPSATNQPISAYLPAAPATYQPEEDLPSLYPVTSVVSAPVGTDGLYAELLATYGTPTIFLMHWLIDVDGAFGFYNGDTSTLGTYINNFQRGMMESTFLTITFPCWDDWHFGGPYGYLPLYGTGTELYPSAPFAYGKQWRYTCAPDAEGRALQWAFRATDMTASAPPAAVTAVETTARKMGDYLRYATMDKYFRQIGNNQVGSTVSAPKTACHYLISWYMSWGGEIPATGVPASWSFRIGSSECHFGYQAPNAAYQMATGGGGHTPLSPTAAGDWLLSLTRQLEMIRWLQTEQGFIAGGVSNSVDGRYLTPLTGLSAPNEVNYPRDGREVATFYGMTYTYSPVWHNPPSNNWFGYQVWGIGRVAELFHTTAGKTSTLALSIQTNLQVILDRWVNCVLANCTVASDGSSFSLPSNLSWVSSTQVVGETTTVANLEGDFEYLPSLNWPGTSPNYATFWSAGSVPNPNLQFTITSTGEDLGVAGSLASTLLLYAQAKRNLGLFTTPIPGTPNGKTPNDCYLLAKALLDCIWTNYKASMGVEVSEPRADYVQYGNPIYIPSIFTGTTGTGDPINAESTFVSVRSFMESDPGYAQIAAYHANPTTAPVPVFTYHRFWAQTEYAMGCAVMHKYFSDLAEAA